MATKMTKAKIKKEVSKIKDLWFVPNNIPLSVAGLNQLFDIDLNSKKEVAEIFAEYVKSRIINMSDDQFEGAKKIRINK